jgi:hypothetical protein
MSHPKNDGLVHNAMRDLYSPELNKDQTQSKCLRTRIKIINQLIIDLIHALEDLMCKVGRPFLQATADLLHPYCLAISLTAATRLHPGTVILTLKTHSDCDLTCYNVMGTSLQDKPAGPTLEAAHSYIKFVNAIKHSLFPVVSQ